MPTLKQLCGVALAAEVLTNLYTAPAPCAISTIVVCNRSGTTSSFRLAHAVAGAASAPGQYFAYDALIAGNTTVPLTLGLCLATGDVLRGYAGSNTLTFMAWGEEQDL